jgi:ribosome-binding factor A
VSYTALGDERARRSSAAALRSAAPHLRRALGKQVRLKVTPELRFEADDSADTGERIDAILEGLHDDG